MTTDFTGKQAECAQISANNDRRLLITNSKLNIKFPVVIGERLEARKPF
jgi:hypothetical protein